jgi:uncharacterized protein YdbL (DUF1318 family)
MKPLILALCALITLCTGEVLAQNAPTKDGLKAQFKAREAELRDLKRRGQVGETIDGYVETVETKTDGDEKTAQLLNDENKDRRALYQLLADEINKENPRTPVKATLETIAVRNAHRNIERAGPDEFLRVGKDHWIRVKDFSAFQKLTQLKTQGRVGETSMGTVEIVKDADRSDKTLVAAVNEENVRRTAEYQALAEKERVDASVITKRMAERNLQNARIGDMVKDESGVWRKK